MVFNADAIPIVKADSVTKSINAKINLLKMNNSVI